MIRFKRFSTFHAVLLSLMLCAIARADPATQPATQPSQPEKYIRFVDDGQGGGQLQTADVAYQNAAGVTVHLIAAIHIGEKAYFQELSKDFESYDAVLYEMVKPKDSAPPGPDTPPSNSGVSQFQRLLKDVLKLDFQLDDIDYTKANFVHADLDKETFERLQAERGESFESLMLHQILDAMTRPTPPGHEQDTDMSLKDTVAIFTRPDGERRVKVMLAKQLDDMESTAMGLDGPGGSVIITERNKAAIAALTDTIANGKKNMAIFYGAAHMTDMSQRLRDLGFSETATDWHKAWDLTLRPDQPSMIEELLDKAIDAMGDQDR